MADVYPLDLLAQELGFALKSEQREALQSLLRGNDVFCVLPTAKVYNSYLKILLSVKIRHSANNTLRVACENIRFSSLFATGDVS